MEKVNNCIERIRVIRGVNCGVITNKQIDLLFDVLDLNEQERKRVFEILKEDNIVPVLESETLMLDDNFDETSQRKSESSSYDDESRAEIRKKKSDEEINKIAEELRKNPNLLERYKEEFLIFSDAIVALSADNEKTVIEKIVDATMKVCDHRIEKIKNDGWVCGSYLERVVDRFTVWVKFMFPENDASELISCIVESKELSQNQIVAIIVLLFNAPKIHLNSNIRLSKNEDD